MAEELNKLELHIEKNSLKYLIGLFCAGIFCVFSVAGMYRFYIPGVISNNQLTWGQFGDYIGGTLNPIVAFFALTALLIAIVHQRIELKTIKKEMNKKGV